GLIASKGG
ncbi:hypothetical protein D027_4736B, partial [Vibrio parahaemolyticus 861]